MDSRSFRPQRPSDRRVINGSDTTARRQSEESVSSVSDDSHRVAPSTTHASSNKNSSSRKRRPAILIAAFVLGIVTGIFGFIAWSGLQNTQGVSIDGSKYQAVSFTDGQLYFGKLRSVDGQYMKLTDVYYLQPQSEDGNSNSNNNLQTSTNQNNFKLTKFTDVIYGPEDEMIIAKSQILFYENLDTNGKVSQLIAQYKQTNK